MLYLLFVFLSFVNLFEWVIFLNTLNGTLFLLVEVYINSTGI